MSPLTLSAVLVATMTVALIFLRGLRLRKSRGFCRQKRAAVAATAAWENEGGHISPS